jgi:general secretion pathway protein F
MALFQYEAINGKGRKINGIIDAESLNEAKQKLLRRQILAIKVEADSHQSRFRLKKSDLLMLTKELARLLDAGLPLYESLSVLEEKYRGHPAHNLILSLCDEIRSGQPFSAVLKEHPDCFDVLFIAMVENAEKGGQLSKALGELIHLMERQEHIRKTIVGALLYPSLLVSFCLIVLSVLLLFVIPSLFDLFEGRSLHPFTAFIFACSHFVLRAKWIFAFLIASVVGWAIWSIVSTEGRSFARRFFLRIPVLSDLLSKSALARFFRAAATLIEGGLPALFALQQANATLRHPPLEEALSDAMRRLSEGESLESALRNRAYIPPLVPRMLSIAQEGGNLAYMMHQIASIYEDDLEKAVSRITSVGQPLILLFLGAMVGFVLLSVLLPLTDVNSFAT